MELIEEIEQAIDRLAPAEFQRFVQWFRDRENQRWDDRIDADSSSGKLDFLFAEADREADSSEWPART